MTVLRLSLAPWQCNEKGHTPLCRAQNDLPSSLATR